MARRVLRTGPLDSGSFARRHVRRIGTDAVRARAQIWAARLLGGRRLYSRSGPVDRGHTDADHFPAELAAADGATAADGLLSVRVRGGDRVVILAAVRRLDGSGHDRPLGPRTPGYAALTRHGLDPQLAHRHRRAHSDRLARALPRSSLRERCGVAHSDGAAGTPHGGLGGCRGALAELVETAGDRSPRASQPRPILLAERRRCARDRGGGGPGGPPPARGPAPRPPSQ